MTTRDRLAEIVGRETDIEGWQSLDVADALLPVVDAIAAERAAEELRAAADVPLKACCPEHASKRLRARAAGLTDKDGQR